MMKNLEVLEEIRKQGKNLIETKRDEFVKQNLLSDEFIQMMQKNKKPFELLMSYYQCAIMEIETKFRVLNQEYSLSYDQNPIEGIKTRVKSYESIMRKIRVKDIPVTLESIEENIRDIREQLQYPPTDGRYRVYIIDEVHMLSIGAFNALLKTL